MNLGSLPFFPNILECWHPKFSNFQQFSQLSWVWHDFGGSSEFEGGLNPQPPLWYITGMCPLLICILITNSMEQSPFWEGTHHTASQESHHLPQNPMLPRSQTPSTAFYPSHINPVHTLHHAMTGSSTPPSDPHTSSWQRAHLTQHKLNIYYALYNSLEPL